MRDSIKNDLENNLAINIENNLNRMFSSLQNPSLTNSKFMDNLSDELKNNMNNKFKSSLQVQDQDTYNQQSSSQITNPNSKQQSPSQITPTANPNSKQQPFIKQKNSSKFMGDISKKVEYGINNLFKSSSSINKDKSKQVVKTPIKEVPKNESNIIKIPLDKSSNRSNISTGLVKEISDSNGVKTKQVFDFNKKK